MYRFLLLLFFSRRTRDQFEREMLRLFDDQIRDARESGRSVARIWLAALWDAAFEGTADRMSALGTQMTAVARESRRWRWWMHALGQDLRYAIRLLLKQPGTTTIAVLTLALGIGANTAIFSAVDTVLLRPLPYDEPDRLAMVWEKRPQEGVFNNVVSPADFVDWSKMNASFEGMAAQSTVPVDLTGYGGEPVRVNAGAVSTEFFDVLRAKALLGRGFRKEEGVIGQHRVIVLGHGSWQNRFGSDPSIVGRTLSVSGMPFEVIGVLPASFQFPDSTIELWIPDPFEGLAQPLSRTSHSLNVYARLKPGITLDQARADMDRVGALLQDQYPDQNRNHSAHVVPLREELSEPVQGGLLLLFGAVAFVLLIACVNVANLLLARAASRRREMAVRAAVGAGRGRLIGQAITESLILGLVGGAAGLVVAYWGIGVLRELVPQNLAVVGVEQLGLDARVLAFTFLLSLATGALFGLLPAWHLASQDVNASLKDGSRSSGGVRRRLRRALVVSEIALASLLLVGAGLTLRSFQTLLGAEAGFTLEGRLTAFVALPRARYQDQQRQLAAFQAIEQRFAAIPGVRAAGAVSLLPLSGQDARSGVAIEGREPTPDAPTRAHPRAVTPDYFRTMGMTLKAGRGFTPADRADGPAVAIVNETMARGYWPGASPIGKRVRLGGDESWREVVGIVRDVRHWGLDQPVNAELYMPHAQFGWRAMNFVVQTDGDPVSYAAAVREQLRAVDQELPLSNVRTLKEVAERSIAARRSAMILLGIFGALALVLAAAGIYGVMAQLVALRREEIGVRMTLGARPSDVLRLVLSEGALQATIGLALGVAAGVLVMRTFGSVLYGVAPADPVTIAAVAVILMVTALAACLIPARRAMKVDPVEALRN